MSILSSIFSKILHPHQPAPAAPAPRPAPAPAPAAQAAPAQGAAPAQPAPTPAAAPAAPAQPVDVEAVLTGLESNSPQTLDWRRSIVDLLKLLDLDSSLAARKALAQELHYTGDTGDSAAMNIWLHRQVMQKLAENGGKVPADLKD